MCVMFIFFSVFFEEFAGVNDLNALSTFWREMILALRQSCNQLAVTIRTISPDTRK